jgi:hypothetical protein
MRTSLTVRACTRPAPSVRASQPADNILRGPKSIDQERGKVLIIAHSMGGLDAVNKLEHDRVGSAAHHHHAPPRQPVRRLVHRNLKKAGRVVLTKFLGLDVEAIHDLTTEPLRRFNRNDQERPRRSIFPVSARSCTWCRRLRCIRIASSRRRRETMIAGLGEKLDVGRAPKSGWRIISW